MAELLQNLINALTIGSSYALVAVGFTMIFGVLRVVYLGHAAVVAACAYVGYAVILYTGNVILAVVAGLVAGLVIGIIVEFIAIRPVRGQDHLIPMVTSISVAIIIEEILRLTVQAGQAISYPANVASTVIRLNVMGYTPYFTVAQLLILVFTVVLVVVLTIIVQRTWLGRTIRAVAESEPVSSLLGIRVNVVSAGTVALASALAGAAGVLLALSLAAIDPRFADTMQFKALAIALFAGMGSIPGAVIGGYMLGFVEAMAMGYFVSSYRDLFAYLLMIVILMIRPQGLLGKGSSQRV